MMKHISAWEFIFTRAARAFHRLKKLLLRVASIQWISFRDTLAASFVSGTRAGGARECEVWHYGGLQGVNEWGRVSGYAMPAKLNASTFSGLSHLSVSGAENRTLRRQCCAAGKRHKKIITAAIIQYVKSWEGSALLKFSSHTFSQFICQILLFCCSCTPRGATLLYIKWTVEWSKWSISCSSQLHLGSFMHTRILSL